MVLKINDLKIIWNSISKYADSIPKDKLELSNQLIECSKRDLEICNLLYERNYFAEYAYHLQQSVEKITKAYAISINVLSQKEYKSISHLSPRAFILIIEKEISSLEIIKKIGFNISIDLKPLSNLINSLESQKEIALYKEEQIVVLLNYFDKVSSQLNFDVFNFDENSVTEINNTSSNLINLMDELNEKDKKFLKNFTNIFSKGIKPKLKEINFKEKGSNYIINLLGLYFLSIITFPHETFTRYPDKIVKPLDYTEELGICKVKSKIIKILQAIIVVIESENKDKKIILG